MRFSQLLAATLSVTVVLTVPVLVPPLTSTPLRLLLYDLLACAQREFTKDTGLVANGEFISLNPVEQKSGKVLQGFAVEADFDLKNFRSLEFSLEWPPRSGRWETFREIDRIEYFGLRTALRKILPYQWPMLLELSEKLGWRMRRASQG